MTITKDQLKEYYQGTDYGRRIRSGAPARPREWHLPLALHQSFSNLDESDISSEIQNKKLLLQLDQEACLDLRATLLHETFFSFYKAFYNYLAAKRLYGGGAEHWIAITCYYAKFYLARAITTLIGKQKYQIRSNAHFFDSRIFKHINPVGYKKILDKYASEDDINYEKEQASYTIELHMDIGKKEGSIEFSNKGVNSHQDIWKTYSELDHKALGLTKMTWDDKDNSESIFGYDYLHLSRERNEENYSFEGYMQLDFNLSPHNFEGYFERDSTKMESVLVYDSDSGIILGVWQELYHLFQELSINGSPTEIEKIKFMISYMLDDSPLKEKLLDLADQNFPVSNKYIDEMNNFYS